MEQPNWADLQHFHTTLNLATPDGAGYLDASNEAILGGPDDSLGDHEIPTDEWNEEVFREDEDNESGLNDLNEGRCAVWRK